jgi:hypothetical protein
LTEKNAEFTRKSEDFSVEFDALKKLISKKVKEIEECNKNMESLSQQVKPERFSDLNQPL